MRPVTLASLDTAGGGTWITVNVHGLALGLLNEDQGAAAGRPRGTISRGLLVKSLAAVRSREEASRRLRYLGSHGLPN